MPVTGFFFDCLAARVAISAALPLVDRKRCLELAGARPRGGPLLRARRRGGGAAFFEAVGELGLEGIVAKRAGEPLRGRALARLAQGQVPSAASDFVVGGYTAPQGSRGHFGALHLGLYDDAGLVYVSKVGTGFDETDARRDRRSGSRRSPAPPRPSPWARRRDAGITGWSRGSSPEVRYTDWTADGGIRHPAFLGLREDRRPEECRRERPLEIAAAERAGRRRGRTARALRNRRAAAGAPDGDDHQPEEGVLAGRGLHQGDLVAYYETVAPHLLPYLRDRPLVLTRYPDGITGKSFFQKDAPDFAPAWIRTERIYSHDTERDIDYFVVDDVESLRYVANLGTIPLHFWSARTAAPGPAGLARSSTSIPRARRSPTWWRSPAPSGDPRRLELPSHVKTSGATGLHILVPMGARYTHEETRTFARLLATLGVEAAGAHRHHRPSDPRARAARSTSTSARTATAAPSWRRTPCARCRARRCPARSAGTR